MNHPHQDDIVSPFDFITIKEFRKSLDSDYKELLNAVQNKSWKAAHVLAGSLVEAMLIDYLLATNHNGLTDDKILGMDLAKAILACEACGVLSPKTAQLSAVIKDYRNLIHPGRIIRLQEDVSEEGATVSLALVNMIAKDIAQRRRKQYGYTAEQILKKIITDSSSVAFYHLLLKEINDTEKERLLIEIFPQRNIELDGVVAREFYETRLILEKCFRLTFDASPDWLKQKSVANFIRIMKEEPMKPRLAYEEAFFRATDLRYALLPADRDIVKRHLLAQLQERKRGTDLLEICSGIGLYITEADVADGTARSLWIPAIHERQDEVFTQWSKFVGVEQACMAKDVGVKFKEDMARHVSIFESRNLSTMAQLITKLVDGCDGVPF